MADRLTTESKNVWIKDPYHKFYPEYVKIIEVLPDGYRAKVVTTVAGAVVNGPIFYFKEDQLTDDLIG